MSDKKFGHVNGSTYDYNADVVNANDYYPFGMIMPNRSYSATNSYRYGFNGKENDNEVKGEGNEQDYGMRVYDPRVGRFLSVDPLAHTYPFYSPYHYAVNNPIVYIDIDGLQGAPSGVRAEVPVIRIELSNTYVGRNGALRTGPGYTIGTLPANSANLPAQTRRITTEELSKMIPPYCTGFSIDPGGRTALVSDPNGSWRISLVRQQSATNMDIKYPTYDELKKWYPQVFASHEQVTNDPSKLTNEQLQQSYERISQGKGTAQDWQYKAEIDRRLAAGTLPIQQKPKVTIDANSVDHIFRKAKGHFEQNTVKNIETLENVANDDKNLLGTDKFGNVWHAQTQADGTQVWTQSRNGKIINGGVNKVPRTFDQATGLSNPEKPNNSNK